MVIRRSGAGTSVIPTRYFVARDVYGVGTRAPRRARQELWEALDEAKRTWIALRGKCKLMVYSVYQGVITRVQEWVPDEETLIDVVDQNLEGIGNVSGRIGDDPRSSGG